MTKIAFDIKYEEKIILKSKFDSIYNTLQIPDNKEECIIWGSITKYARISYFSISLKKRSYFYCHNLIYFFTFGKYLKKEGKISYEISHLCHKKGCVNLNHLTRESKSVNENRKKCSKKGYCTNNHKPKCIFK